MPITFIIYILISAISRYKKKKKSNHSSANLPLYINIRSNLLKFKGNSRLLPPARDSRARNGLAISTRIAYQDARYTGRRLIRLKVARVTCNTLPFSPLYIMISTPDKIHTTTKRLRGTFVYCYIYFAEKNAHRSINHERTTDKRIVNHPRVHILTLSRVA